MLTAFLLQSTVFAGVFDIGGAVPDLILIVVISYAYEYGKLDGMFAGILGGFFLDIQFGEILGVYALIYMLIGYACGFFNKFYVKYDTLLPVCIITVAEFICSFFGYIVNILVYSDVRIAFYIKRVMLPKTAYTMVAALVVYKLCDYIYLKVMAPVNEEE